MASPAATGTTSMAMPIGVTMRMVMVLMVVVFMVVVFMVIMARCVTMFVVV